MGSSVTSGVPSSFFSLPVAASFGRKSATAAAITIASASSAYRITASRICSAVVMRTTWAPAGGATVPGPRIRCTVAPRRAASAATATPIFPLEWLPMNRTGSIGS